MDTATDKLLALARKEGLIRARDLAPLGIARVALTRAVRQGQLQRLGRGLYGLPSRRVSQHATLAEAPHLITVFRQISAIACEDGMIYPSDSVRTAEIRKEANYAGIRVNLVGSLDGRDARCSSGRRS